MLTPRYFFSEDFRSFDPYFRSQPHRERQFQKGEYLWAPGEPHQKLYYFLSGTAVHYADHESGRRKIISFHGPGTVFPGYHPNDYKIELSLSTAALSPVLALEFTKEQFGRMFAENRELSRQVVSWYSMYVNLFLFETVHQEYNSTLVKLCNLLYLLTSGQPRLSAVEITQEELAELLGVSRVQLTRSLTALRNQGVLSTSRGKIQVCDRPALAALCTSETQP